MTNREKSLLMVFLVTLLGAGVIMTMGSYWETLARLDGDFITLQQRALRVTQTKLNAKVNDKVIDLVRLKARFFAPGTLPDVLLLATRATDALTSSGLTIEDSRVKESTTASQWVEYRALGQMQSWFTFLQAMRQNDTKTLFRSLSLLRKEGSVYSITFDVGHSVLP